MSLKFRNSPALNSDPRKLVPTVLPTVAQTLDPYLNLGGDYFAGVLETIDEHKTTFHYQLSPGTFVYTNLDVHFSHRTEMRTRNVFRFFFISLGFSCL